MNEFFQEKGTAQQLLTSQPLPLNKPESVFAFKGGPINLFIQRKGAEPIRHFLASFTENDLLLSFDHPSFEMVLIPVAAATVYECSYDQATDFLKGNPEHLDRWLEAITQAIQVPPPEGNLLMMAPETELTLQGTDRLASENKQLLWIKCKEGALALLGRETHSLTPQEEFYPLTSTCWFKPQPTAKVTAIHSKTLFEQNDWKKSLSTFLTLFSPFLFEFIEQKEKELKELQINRSLEETENLNLSLQQLENVFVPESLVNILGKIKDPLEQALTLIGHFMKIKFVFPKEETSNKSIEERIDLICQASKIQKRKIKIEDDWWKENHGSLLAFKLQDKQPVSIIRLDQYKYMDKDRSEYMTEKLAKELSTTGYMFYRRFESKLKTGKEALLFFYRNYYKELIKIIPIGVLGVFFALLPPVATKLLFSYAIPARDPSLVLYLTFGLLFSALGFSFFYLLQGLVILKMQGLGAHLIQTLFWDRILALSPRFFRRYMVGNLFGRIFAIEEIRAIFNSQGSDFAITAIFAILYFGMMMVYSPLLGTIALLFALVGLGVTLVCSRSLLRTLRESLEAEGDLDGITIQMIQGIPKLRVAGVEKSAFSYWASAFAKNNALRLKIKYLQNTASFFSTLLPILTTLSVYFVLLKGITTNTLSLPDFLAFNIAFGSFSVAIYPLYSMLLDLTNLVPLWERAKVILEEPLESSIRAISPGKVSGDISIQNLIFSYSPTSLPVLNGLSLTIKPREFIGIVGKTGCGKSTLIRLLLGFEKPDSGVILFDGIDLSSLDLQAVRRQLGVVLQGGGLMAGSIYDILSSGGTYTSEEFERALKLSGFDEDLATLPMGYNTIIPANANTLSGGQKQRLMLARALIGTPSILIFDEATSSLDNKSQDKIVKNIENLNVTRIAIAQRLSTIRKADRIYVFDKGIIAQQGTFEELAKAPGLFADMLSKQKNPDQGLG